MNIHERVLADTKTHFAGVDVADPTFAYVTDDYLYDAIADAIAPADEELAEATDSAASSNIIYGTKLFRLGSTLRFTWVDYWHNWTCTTQTRSIKSLNISTTFAGRRCGSDQIYQIGWTS